MSQNEAWLALDSSAMAPSACYTLPGNRGFVSMLEDYGHLLSEDQVDEIGRVVGQYQATLSTMI